MIRTLILIYAIFLLFVNILFSQVTQEWVQRYNSSGNIDDQAVDMAVDTSGNVYSTGWTDGVTILKYNKNGQLIWNKFINELYLYPRNITLSNSGKIYVSCIVDWGGWVLIKYDSSGNFIWSKEFSNGVGSVNEPTAFLLDENENSYMTGAILDSGIKKVGFVKYDSSGTLLWTKYYNYAYGGYMNAGTSIIMDSNKNIIIGGYLNVRPITLCNTLVIKYSPTGEQLWSAIYDTTMYISNQCVKLICDKQNNIIVGLNIRDTSLSFHVVFLKYSNNGNLILDRYYAGPTNTDNLVDIVPDKKSNIFLLIRSGSNTYGGYEYSTMKYDSSGNYNWERRYTGNNILNMDFPYCIYVDTSSNSFVTGSTVSMKYNSNGSLLWMANNIAWTNEYNNSGNVIKLDRFNNIYIFGNGYSTISQSQDLLIVKYSQTTGISNQNKLIDNYKLEQNYPNPFNSSTVIHYELSRYSKVNLKIYDLLGREIFTLINGDKNAGKYDVLWDAINYPSGIYFFKIIIEDKVNNKKYTETKKMIYIK
jgi:hypothetical protein